MKFIFGLGNPGKKYERTRHNIGWDAVTAAARETGAVKFQTKDAFKAEIAEANVNGEKIAFIHPLTFMNLSGDAVQSTLQFYKAAASDALIVHDEMDFPLGAFAFIADGGPAGHNGVASIQERLGTKAIARLRIGIGRPVAPMAAEVFVLQKFHADEHAEIVETEKQAAAAVIDWIKMGTAAAMNKWNRSKNSYARLDS